MKSFKMMSYKDLILEHKNLVRTLKSGKKTAINKLLKEQSAELQSYQKAYNMFLLRGKK